MTKRSQSVFGLFLALICISTINFGATPTVDANQSPILVQAIKILPTEMRPPMDVIRVAKDSKEMEQAFGKNRFQHFKDAVVMYNRVDGLIYVNMSLAAKFETPVAAGTIADNSMAHFIASNMASEEYTRRALKESDIVESKAYDAFLAKFLKIVQGWKSEGGMVGHDQYLERFDNLVKNGLEVVVYKE